MNQSQFRRFAQFYGNSRYLAADAALQRYLGLDDELILPIYVAHGVDFGFYKAGFDIHLPEPLYWATNPRTASLARRHKPTVEMPHPFLMAASEQTIPDGEGTLVIGPPPSPLNDRNLLAMLDVQSRPTVLVKPHPGRFASARFWNDAGIRTVCLLDEGASTYDNMVRLLGRYRRVISGTVSSAMIFAAALGKEVQLLRGYRYRAYEELHIHNLVDFHAMEARRIVRILAEGSAGESTATARALLGANYLGDCGHLRDNLLGSIESLKMPVYCQHPLPLVLKKAVAEAALRLDWPNLLQFSLAKFARRRLTPFVMIMDIDEVAMWLEGPAPENVVFERTPVVSGDCEPGMAVDPY